MCITPLSRRHCSDRNWRSCFAISHPRIIEAFIKCLLPIIVRSVEDTFKVLRWLRSEITDFIWKIRERDEQITSLQSTNHELKHDISIHQQKLKELEVYSWVDNLVVYGLPESCAETLIDNQSGEELHVSETSAHPAAVFLGFCHKTLEIDIRPSDISIYHKLKNNQTWKRVHP